MLANNAGLLSEKDEETEEVNNETAAEAKEMGSDLSALPDKFKHATCLDGNHTCHTKNINNFLIYIMPSLSFIGTSRVLSASFISAAFDFVLLLR